MAGAPLKHSAVMNAAALCETDWSDGEILSLDEAISLLESGKVSDELQVDFGDGTTSKVETGPGLLQRLKGHRMLLAVAGGAADLTATRSIESAVFVDPEAAALLDALPQK